MEKINIAELLKNCPKGMELDCTMYDKVTLLHVDDKADIVFPIRVLREDGNSITLTKYGQFTDADFAKCVIFPKGKTTWEGFVPPVEFKAGDVLYTVTGEGEYRLCIVDCIIGDTLYTKASCSCNGHFLCTCEEQFNIEELVVMRFATKEEKQILFDAIKDIGYKWNAETKTLEKFIDPKFKVGDNIRIKGESVIYVVREVRENLYILDTKDISLPFKIQYQDKWELVPNKFDINTLVPFESKVLVREYKTEVWEPKFYGFFNQHNKRFYTTSSGTWLMCIPYNEDTKHLTGTTDDCDDFYKSW